NAAGQARQNEQPGQPGARPEGQEQIGQGRRIERGTATERQAAPAGSMRDAQFAACLIIDNEMEIALARLAAQHSQNDQVKQFAQKMIQDHQQYVQQLQDVAASGGYQVA